MAASLEEMLEGTITTGGENLNMSSSCEMTSGNFDDNLLESTIDRDYRKIISKNKDEEELNNTTIIISVDGINL